MDNEDIASSLSCLLLLGSEVLPACTAELSEVTEHARAIMLCLRPPLLRAMTRPPLRGSRTHG